MKGLFLITGLTAILIYSCKDRDEDHFDFGRDYFPLADGSFIVYQVSEIMYDDFNHRVDTSLYFLKEAVDSGFVDSEGRTVHKLLRYTRVSDSLNWVLRDVWKVYAGKEYVERVEENVSFTVLNFPLFRGKTWNGNVRNTLDDETYTVLDFDLKSSLYGKNFEQTCRVNHRNNVNLIEEQVAEDVYARGIGLVLRRDDDLSLTDGEVTAGHSILWTFLEHGSR